MECFLFATNTTDQDRPGFVSPRNEISLRARGDKYHGIWRSEWIDEVDKSPRQSIYLIFFLKSSC
ncbi:hypothetical protein ACFOG5_20985 [Pedobacter fastidiosus]|uniref:hypothetical protein n=1 Tax=Pedobacter fastidiosus TaxID=2765361 RepID=UPI00361138E0